MHSQSVSGALIGSLLLLSIAGAQPTLLSFSLSLTPPEQLLLTFDTSLSDSSCDVTRLTLQNSLALIIEGSHSPSSGSCSFIENSDTTLNASLEDTDWEAIQANVYLATTANNTYVSLQTGFLTNGSNSAISTSSALQVTPELFSPNTDPPTVQEATLDLDSGILLLRLYEGSSYSPAAAVEFSDSTGNGGPVLLSEVSTADDVRFFFTLPPSFLNAIKLASPPVFLSLPAGLFIDGGGTPSPAQSSIPVSLSPDTTAPQVTSFTFDLDSGQLSFSFSEPIATDSVDLTEVYLTSSLQGREGGVSLGSGMVESSGNFNTEISISVSMTTLNSIKADTSLCTSLSNCLLNLNSTAFTDTSTNPLLSPPSNLVPGNLTADTTQPALLSYAIDLGSGVVTLTFSEPVASAMFDPSGISLSQDEGQPNMTMSGDGPVQYPPVVLGGASLVGVAQDSTVLSILLETSALNQVKTLVSSGNLITYTMEDFTVQDTSGNSVTPIPPSSSSFPPSSTTSDQTSPILLEFIANQPETRQLTFIFNEIVDVSTWNVSALVLSLHTVQGTTEYTFTEGTVGAVNGNSVTLTINNSEYIFSSLMEQYREAYERGSLAVTTRGILVEDLFGNPLLSVTEPLQYNNTVTTDNPVLQSMTFDLDSGRLDLNFSIPVIVSYPGGRVRFQNQAYLPAHVLTLASNGSYTPHSGLVDSVSFTLGGKDLSSLKLNLYLATSIENTFVVLAETFATGSNSLPLAVQNGTRTEVFTPDTQGPEVTRFDLDLDSNILSLEFNEPVPVESFDATAITLTSSSSTDGVRVQLSNRTYALAQDNLTSFRALLTVEDATEIKRHPLCYSVENCYVSYGGDLVTDVSANPSLPTSSPSPVDAVSPDVTPPQFVAFPVFDLNSGLFTIIFSEPVNGSSADHTQIQFSDSPTDPSTSVTLTGGVTSPDHIEIDFYLPRVDLNMLKYHLDLCTNRDDCWVRLPSFFISDIGMNPFIHPEYLSDAEASFHQPAVFIPDTTTPELVYVSMDLDQGTLTLSFSEVIVEATFSPDDVTLLSSPSSSLSLTLSGDSAYSRSATGAELTVQLTSSDLNWLKSQDLFTSLDNSFLSLDTNLEDVSGNAFVDISSDNAFQVSEVIQDTTGPQLVTFDLFNLDNSSFIIAFDEPVSVSSLDVTQVSLVSQPSGQATLYALTGAASITALGDLQLGVMVELSSSDRVQIKLLSALAEGESSTYIALLPTAITDTSENYNEEIPVLQAIPLSTGGYIPDTSPASLTGFSLDLDSSSLFLTFDDVISASSINTPALTLQNTDNRPTSAVALTTQTTPVGGDSDHVTLTLSQGDLFDLQLDLDLATGTSNTYISIFSSFAEDIEGRDVVEIRSSNALQITSLVPDTTPPSLSSFSLDMDSGRIVLTFSEPILPSSADPSHLSLQSQATAGGSSLSLSPATSVLTLSQTSLSLKLEIVYSDLNTLKATQGLATGPSDTFLSLTSDFVTDTNANPIVAMATSAGTAVLDFTPDSTHPELRRFDADLTPVAKLYLTFSETILLNGQIQDTLTLLNSPDNPSITIVLTASDGATQTALDTVEISISPANINRLLVDDIATSVDSLYVSLREGAVEDSAGNMVTPTSALRVNSLYKSCFSNTYNNATEGGCRPCASECTDSCSGPVAVIGSGGCDSCGGLLLDREGRQMTCTDLSITSCPLGYFPTSSLALSPPVPDLSDDILICQLCHPLCATCDGPNDFDCQTCSSAFIPNSGATVECLESCDGGAGDDCVTCHSQCVGCMGPSDRECVACREDVVVREGVEVCVPRCTGNTFLSDSSGEFMCESCDLECVGCSGSTSSDCLSCRGVSLLANGTSVCVESCPHDYYDSGGSCQRCHDYCDGCTGPSSRNCTECVEDSVEVEEGGMECVPSCPLGQEYDTSKEACKLTSREFLYLTIAASAAGGLITLLVVVLVISCCCYRYRKRRKKQGVFFISAKFDTKEHEMLSLPNKDN